MAFFNANNYNYIHLLCLIIFAWQMCVAKQLPMPANVADTTTATTTTNNANNNNKNVQETRHGSYDADIDDDIITPNEGDDVGDGAIDSDAGSTRAARRRRQVSDWFIAPNTRWCGKGNLANGTYNQLGGASMADKCCRKHDHCKKYIPALANRYDLFNYRPYTLSHCTCDRRFRTCLKMAGDEDANTIGKLFFNMVQTKCFILKTERICQQRGTGKDAHVCLKETERKKAYLKDNLKF